MRKLLDSSKKFFKANLHCHTKNSDGAFSPERIKEEYKARGYSVVAYTDHEHVISNYHLRDEDFLPITAAEIAIKENSQSSTMTSGTMRAAHLSIYALDPENTVTPCYNSVYDHFITPEAMGRVKFSGEFAREYSAKGISDIVRAMHESGFLVCYNHPGWSLESAEEYLGYEGIDFVEIFNTGSVVKGLYDDEAAFAELIRAGKRVYCTAADDNHNRRPLDSPHSDSFGGFVMINADRLGYSEILSSLSSGNFYASTGPEIFSLESNGEEVIIECSACKKISLLTEGRRSLAKYPEKTSRGRCRESFKIPDGALGFRIRIEDGYGARAYSQFYYVNDITS